MDAVWHEVVGAGIRLPPPGEPAPLRVLIVEDVESDAELMAAELRRDGMEISWRRVERRDEYRLALQHGGFDLILSDFSLPGFDGMQALELARRLRPEVPFLFVSGTIGADRAITALRAGATDYVLKDDLSRLPSLSRRALAEAAQRRLAARATARLELLSTAARRLLASSDPFRTAEEVYRAVADHLGCDLFLSFLFDEASGRMRLAAWGGIPPPVARENEWLDVGEGVCGYVALTGERVVVEAIDEWPDPRGILLRSLGVRTYACHPLIAGGRIVGTIGFGSRERDALDADDIEYMKSMAEQVTTALERARLVEGLRQANHELSRSNDALEVRVTERTAELRRALLARDEALAALEQQQAALEEANLALSKQAAELAEAHASLERRVQERTAELAEANELLRHQAYLLDNVHDAVVALDGDLHVTAWNRAAVGQLGCAAEEALGQDLVRVCAARQIEVDWPAFLQQLAEHGRYEGEMRRRDEDGAERTLEIAAVRLPRSPGHSSAYITVCRDVTEQQRSREALEQYAQRVAVLHEVDRRVLAAVSSSEIAHLAASHMRDVIGCERASVVVYDFEAHTAEEIAVAGQAEDAGSGGLRYPLDAIRIPDALRRGEPTLEEDLLRRAQPTADEQILLSRRLRSLLSVPLLSEGTLIGAMQLSSGEVGGFSGAQIEMALEVATSFAVALQNARLVEQLRVSRAQLQALARRLVEVQEEERRAVARELHDEAGQSLTALMVHLRVLERESHNRAGALSRIDELRSVTGLVMESLQALAQRLRPPVLDRVGLSAALAQLLDGCTAQGIRIDLEARGLEGERMPAEVETTVYRVVQEALTNVAQHADANQVTVLVERGSTELVVVVEDDGRGFDVVDAQSSAHVGLIGMRERADLLGGQLEIESAPGSGTTVRLELPLAPRA